jgi:hypothetical protein
VHGASGWDLAEVDDHSAGLDRDRRVESLLSVCVETNTGAPMSREDIMLLSLGDFHLLLAALSQMTFGNSVELSQACPQPACGEPMGWTLLMSQLIESLTGAHDPVTELAIDGRRYEIRPATLGDTAAIRRDSDPFRALLECSVEPQLDEMSDDGLKLLEHAFDELDPLASITFNVPCSSCGLSFQSELDLPAIVSDLWRADDRHRAGEDHLLSSCYGWTPDDLAGLLPTARRRLADALLDRWQA